MLCSRKTAPTVVKLMDFGLSRIAKDGVLTIGNTENDSDLGPDGLMLTPVGTPGFVAPEIIMTLPYGKEIDIFACGVVMYWILSGRLPFHDTDAQMVMERIKKTDFVFPEEDWKGISKSAMDLVSRMLDRSPYARISASDSLSHPWLAKTVYPSRGDARKERQVETGQGSDA